MSAVPATAKKVRKATARFETKPVMMTRFIHVPVDAKEDLTVFIDAFLISGEEDHNAKTWDAIRRNVTQGPFEAVKLIASTMEGKKKEVTAWVNGNGRLERLPMNERASALHYAWLAKNRPHLDIGELEYHCLVVGEIVYELAEKGTVVINRDLTEDQIKDKIAALTFADTVHVISDRVYCADPADAMMVSLAIRGRK